MKSINDARVSAVVVTYLPQLEPLAELLTILVSQVAHIMVVDNTPSEDRRMESLLSAQGLQKVRLIRLGDNAGIAKALNIGIEAAIETGATHVLLSDQDSLPAPNMVAGLLLASHELLEQGHRVGAVGPSFIDQISKQPYRFQVIRPGHWFYGNQQPTEAVPHVRTLSLITSGTLIPVDGIRVIGTMREDLFIDHVDVEWCHRALAQGFSLFGTCYASMTHRMGDNTLRAWTFRWREFSEYGPLRLYYRFRNFICLLRLSFVPNRWKLRASCFWLQEAYIHVLFSRARLASLRMIMLGCWDGLHGCLGRYPDNQHRHARRS